MQRIAQEDRTTQGNAKQRRAGTFCSQGEATGEAEQSNAMHGKAEHITQTCTRSHTHTQTHKGERAVTCCGVPAAHTYARTHTQARVRTDAHAYEEQHTRTQKHTPALTSIDTRT